MPKEPYFNHGEAHEQQLQIKQATEVLEATC